MPDKESFLAHRRPNIGMRGVFAWAGMRPKWTGERTPNPHLPALPSLSHLLITNILGKSHVLPIFSAIKSNNGAFQPSSQSNLQSKKKVVFFFFLFFLKKVYKEPKIHVLGNNAKRAAFSQPYLWLPYKGLCCFISTTWRGRWEGREMFLFTDRKGKALEG